MGRHRIARSQICNRNYLLFLKRKKNIFGVKMSAESQITALGISLPDAPKPGGVYAPALIVGDMFPGWRGAASSRERLVWRLDQRLELKLQEELDCMFWPAWRSTWAALIGWRGS